MQYLKCTCLEYFNSLNNESISIIIISNTYQMFFFNPLKYRGDQYICFIHPDLCLVLVSLIKGNHLQRLRTEQMRLIDLKSKLESL